jgi:hypothetical protein
MAISHFPATKAHELSQSPTQLKNFALGLGLIHIS